jgi:hypothetical protein
MSLAIKEWVRRKERPENEKFGGHRKVTGLLDAHVGVPRHGKQLRPGGPTVLALLQFIWIILFRPSYLVCNTVHRIVLAERIFCQRVSEQFEADLDAASRVRVPDYI